MKYFKLESLNDYFIQNYLRENKFTRFSFELEKYLSMFSNSIIKQSFNMKMHHFKNSKDVGMCFQNLYTWHRMICKMRFDVTYRVG